MDIIRVFPRRTEATPTDALAIIGEPPQLIHIDDPLRKAKEIHISVAFTYDKNYSEFLAYQWEALKLPVKLGGPAYGDYTKEFIPGMYLKEGFAITSTGCPNHCWFCSVPKRAGSLKELDIKDGWIIQDDNLLACSEGHIKAVFDMLKRQKHRPEFRGGLEAKLLKPWHAELLRSINPQSMFFAYDTPDDYEPLIKAGKLLNEYGLNLQSRKNYCYVLIGYKNDTFEKATKRLEDTLKAGFIPFAMLYKNEQGIEDAAWKKFQRQWARPAIIISNYKEMFPKKVR